ncbi:MAG TPA: hypothetical protein VK695_08690 [Steroidobacteraceae bacterium]|jgi:hypothetical protein|nr:hypothetical protein [Steroidobacteraceae bacterium]
MFLKIKKAVGVKGAGRAAALSLVGLSAAGQVYAACSGPAIPASGHSSARLVPAIYQSDSVSELSTASDERFERDAIVGLWEFEFRLEGAQNGLPDKALFDWGLATWHRDGTEIQFSGARVPSAGDVCMGVWRQVGRHEFRLHHIALGLTPPNASGTFVGPAIIDATVTVDPDGGSYTGHQTVTIYPGSPDDGSEFNEQGTPLVTFSGTITAKRFAIP